MILRPPPSRRRGASLAEAAITYSVVLLLTLGVIIVGLGVYRYQVIASLAREGTRWASVHGGQYHQETGGAMATQCSVYTTAILPKAVGLDTTRLSCSQFAWGDPYNSGMPTYDDGSGLAPNVVTNTVTVTVTYTWVPEAYLPAVTLSSTSVMPVQY
jgi:hypothetical protein